MSLPNPHGSDAPHSLRLTPRRPNRRSPAGSLSPEGRMRSKAQIKGHPIHPMLVAFPIAFLYGGLLFDAAGRVGGWASAWTTGGYLSLAAVVSGLVAAVPGLIDYLLVVPPDS